MSADRHRWMKFWPQDWENDECLRVCSLGARGLWIAMLCLMHRADPYGHLLVNGRAPSPKKLAAIIGGTEKEITGCLQELEEEGVFDRLPNGVIFSRRMVRDKIKSDEGREHGRSGGNPALIGGVKGARYPSPIRGADNRANNDWLTVGVVPARAREAESESESESDSPPTPSSKSGRSPPSASDDEAFAAFWSAYPRREAKGQARRAWSSAVRKAAPEQIMAGLARYHFADDPKFRPLPATWLNGERWLDEAQPTPPPPATSAHTGTGAPNGYAHPPPPDPDDAWGLIAWATRVCAGVTATFPGGVTKPAINHCDVLDLGRQVCEAAGIPPDARPRLDALAAWCRDDVWQPTVDVFDLHHGGNRLHAIMPAIRRQAERMRERGETVTSLAVFDATVRQASAARQRARPPESDDDGWPT